MTGAAEDGMPVSKESGNDAHSYTRHSKSMEYLQPSVDDQVQLPYTSANCEKMFIPQYMCYRSSLSGDIYAPLIQMSSDAQRCPPVKSYVSTLPLPTNRIAKLQKMNEK